MVSENVPSCFRKRVQLTGLVCREKLDSPGESEGEISYQDEVFLMIVELLCSVIRSNE
jgi:hypothetical protein